MISQINKHMCVICKQFMHNQSQIATCNSSQETGFLPYIKLVQKIQKKRCVIFFYQQHMISSYQHQCDVTIAATM